MCRGTCAHINTRSCRCLETCPNSQRHTFTPLSPPPTRRNIQSTSRARVASVSVVGRQGLVCSAVCDRHCLSHFTLCLQCLSESGARSGGVTALICHADGLGNEKSSQHRSHARWEQTLNSVLLCISLSLHPHLDPTQAGYFRFYHMESLILYFHRMSQKTRAPFTLPHCLHSFDL